LLIISADSVDTGVPVAVVVVSFSDLGSSCSSSSSCL
jgi:hypothetical protein